MRTVYCCIFKCLKILNLGSLMLLTVGGKLKKDVSLLSLLSSLLSCFLLSLQQGLCSPDWLHPLCPVPFLLPGAVCQVHVAMLVASFSWLLTRDIVVKTQAFKLQVVCATPVWSVSFQSSRYLNWVVVMIVEEIPFVLGCSVKYLGPKVAEIYEWLSSGHVYCQTYF